jgi:hypothetical protein
VPTRCGEPLKFNLAIRESLNYMFYI